MGHVMFYFHECGVIRRLDCKTVRFFFFLKFGFARRVASKRSETTKKLPWTILEELPVPRNTAASQIVKGVISLL